mgnify:CR=1 FL=1
MKTKIKELLDQATILAGAKTNEEIADYLDKSGVVAFPVQVGDFVYFLVAKGMFGSLLTSGTIVERRVDAVLYDGKIKIASFSDNINDPVGNCYEYFGEKVFETAEKAEKALEEMRKKAGF